MLPMVASTTSKSAPGCEIADCEMQIPYMADNTIKPCRTKPMRMSVLHVNWPRLELHTPIPKSQEGTLASSVVNPVGEPDAGTVRFDERGWETERWPQAASYRSHPQLYHTDWSRMSALRWCREMLTVRWPPRAPVAKLRPPRCSASKSICSGAPEQVSIPIRQRGRTLSLVT